MNKTYTCPGKCNDCTTPCGLPICYQMQENDRVLFALHGQGVKPESAARAAKRYAANCKKALEELRPGFNPAAVKKIASTANSKVGNAPVINQPAIMTCSNHNANCAGGCGGGTCYALHGQTAYYPSVRARVRNWLLFVRDPERYFEMAAAETRDYRRARWHDSGDIVNARYLQGMIDTARKNPGTVYSTMTKKFEMVNDYICQHGGSRAAALPENLIIMYSAWGNLYDVNPGSALNPFNMPVAAALID